MIKRLSALLMIAASLSSASTNNAIKAYQPFPTQGLAADLQADSYTKYAYAPATVYFNGQFHQFYCSNGQNTDNFSNPFRIVNFYKSWDHIRYRTSKDGVNWSAPKIVLTVNNNNTETCACDPSVVYGDDGYWYMLFDGNVPGDGSRYGSNFLQNPRQGTVVYLARSYFIGGPYFKYTPTGWENENGMSDNPKIMLQQESLKYLEMGNDGKPKRDKDGKLVIAEPYGVGQQSVVKVAGGDFYVWFRNSANEIRLVHKSNLTQINYDSSIVNYYKEGNRWRSFEGSPYSIGDVRFNVAHNRWEMWCAYGYMSENIKITKFKSDGGVYWEIDNENDVGPYNFIHNIGVSGDARGWIWDNKYLVSFSGPNPGLHETKASLKNKGYNIDLLSDQIPLVGLWPMWQEFVGTSWNSVTINYSSSGFTFPHNVSGTNVDYFTGDYDGDGIADLGAVDRSTKKWYVYSTRNRSYIYDGVVFFSEMNDNYEVIAGDYDGDGKTDIGAVDKANGKWYIYSSITGRPGIGSAPTAPNWIPWGWPWGGMNASFKIAVGDYNGDGIADRAIYNGSNWYIISSLATDYTVADGFWDVRGYQRIPFGWSWNGMTDNHVVVSGDFDGDGITDRTIYGMNDGKWSSLSSRTSGGTLKDTLKWYRNIKLNYSKINVSDVAKIMTNGSTSGWFNGDDNVTSVTTLSSGQRVMFYRRNQDVVAGVESYSFRQIGGYRADVSYQNTKPFAGDFDGDGVDDIVNVNLSTGRWNIYRSSDGATVMSTWNRLKNADAQYAVVLVGDFNGDGKADKAFADKSTRKFYVVSSRTGNEGINETVKYVSKNPNTGYFAKPASEKPIEEPKVAPVVPKAPSMDVSVSGQKVSVTNVESGSNVIVFNMLGKKVFSAIANEGSVNFDLPSRGKFVVRVGSQSRAIVVK